jgi:muramidase (phage lysozyme)
LTTAAVIGAFTIPVAHAAEETAEKAPNSAPTAATTTTTTTVPITTKPITTKPITTKPTGTPAPTAGAGATTTTVAPATTTAPATTKAPAAAAKNVIAYPSQMAHILATIRYVESRGDYSAPLNKGRASGAYQFITSTWDGYGGYPEAYLAPPELQDERAAADVDRFLAQWDNDVSMIPVMWYYPRASRDVALMDVVPVPSAGNVLTVREYQQRWLAVWSSLSGQPIPRPLTLADQLARMGFAPELAPPTPIDPATPAVERTATVAFPVLGPTRLAAPECGDAQDVDEHAGASGSPADIEAAGLCAEEAPAIVFGVKMQPVLAVADGVITDVHDEPGDTISVTITDTVGRSYELAGFNDDSPGTDDGAAPAHLRLTSLATVGRSVRAGQVLGFMGDTDPLPVGIRADVPTDATVQIPVDAVAPHIRLTISDLDGTPVDAYGPVIDALFRQVCSVGIGPWSGSQADADIEPVVTETTDDRRDIDSEWEITSTGQVNASGWAAMIYPSESCGWAPPEKRGPGAGGPTAVPDSWSTPIDLPTSIWVDLALRDDATRAVPVLRP